MNEAIKSMCIPDLHGHMCFYMEGKDRIPSLCAAHFTTLEIRAHLMALAFLSGEFTKEQVERRKVRLGKERQSHGDKEVPVYLRAQSLQGVLQARYRTKSLPYSPPAEIPLWPDPKAGRPERPCMFFQRRQGKSRTGSKTAMHIHTRLAQTVEAKLNISSF